MGTSQSWMVVKPSIGQGTDFCFRKTGFSAFVHVCSCWSCSYHCFGLVPSSYLGFLSRGYAFKFSCIYWIFNCSLTDQVYGILFLVIFQRFMYKRMVCKLLDWLFLKLSIKREGDCNIRSIKGVFITFSQRLEPILCSCGLSLLSVNYWIELLFKFGLNVTFNLVCDHYCWAYRRVGLFVILMLDRVCCI